MTDEKSASEELREPIAVPIEQRTKDQLLELYKAACEDGEYFRKEAIQNATELASLRERLAAAEALIAELLQNHCNYWPNFNPEQCGEVHGRAYAALRAQPSEEGKP